MADLIKKLRAFFIAGRLRKLEQEKARSAAVEAALARAADTRSKLEAALAKPLPESHDMISGDDFDPWGDVIEGIHGHYAKGSDDLMIEALEAVRDGETFTFIDRKGFVGEFVLYVLSGHGLTEYGTSPRGGFPDPSIADLWQPLIDKWKAYKDIAWGAK